MRRLLPILLILGYAGAAPPAAKAVYLYKTGFEASVFSPGELVGQDGWTSDIGPAENIVVQTDLAFTGAQAVRFDAAGARDFTRVARTIHFDTSGSAKTLIKLRVTMYLASSDHPSEWRITGFQGNGNVIGLARVSTTGTLFADGAMDHSTGVTVTRDTWHIYELHFRFDTRTFDLLFDDEVVATDQPFAEIGTPTSVFQTVFFEVVAPGTDQAFFDKLSVTARQP